MIVSLSYAETPPDFQVITNLINLSILEPPINHVYLYLDILSLISHEIDTTES